MKQLIFSSLVITILFCACGKDSNDILDPVAPVTNDSIYLSKVIALDTTKTAPFDTVYLAYYTYNNHKLLSHDFFEFASTGAATESTSNDFFYNGTDSMPFKLIQTELLPLPVETYTHFFTYQPGTRNHTEDSIVHENAETLVVKRIFTGDSFESYTDLYTSSGQSHNGPFYTTIVKQNGNIVSQKDTINGIVAEQYTCSYDNHPNPFYNISWYNNTRIPSIYKTGADCFGPVNNVTEIDITSGQFAGPPGFYSDYTYTWTYRSDGYPIKGILRDNGSSSPDHLNKILYFYTN